MKLIIPCLLAIASASAAPALAQSAAPVDLSAVEVRAINNVIVRVNASGDMGPSTVVWGDVAGINCGPDQYKYTPHQNRQCWVWVRRNSPVKLTIKGMKGSFGADWKVAWGGCQVVDNGAACTLKPGEDAEVSAVITGTPE